MHFFRDSAGIEVDLLIEHEGRLHAVEVKAGETVTQDYFKGLRQLAGLGGITVGDSAVVYGGMESQPRSDFAVIPALQCDRLFARWLDGPVAVTGPV